MIIKDRQKPAALRLREFSDADIGLLDRWLDAPHVRPWFTDKAAWMSEFRGRRDLPWLHHFIVELDGRAIGLVQYYTYADGGETWYDGADMDGVYGVDYLLGEAELLGQGLGKAMLGLLTDTVRAVSGARIILADADPKNLTSRRTLLACGFVERNSYFELRL